MTNFFSSVYFSLLLIVLCVVGLAACFLIAVDIITLSNIAAAGSECINALSNENGVACASALGGWKGLDFHNLERYSENIEDYAGQHNPPFLVEQAKKMNEQADRLEFLFMDIETNPKSEQFGYEMILPWRERQQYVKRTAAAKLEQLRYRAEALADAKEADKDEDFQEGYKEFLASEFDLLND